MVRTALVPDSRGQSEVTGTILLVAIAVVLGALVGGYALNVEFVCKSGDCGNLSPSDWSSDDEVTSRPEA